MKKHKQEKEKAAVGFFHSQTLTGVQHSGLWKDFFVSGYIVLTPFSLMNLFPGLVFIALKPQDIEPS